MSRDEKPVFTLLLAVGFASAALATQAPPVAVSPWDASEVASVDNRSLRLSWAKNPAAGHFSE